MKNLVGDPLYIISIVFGLSLSMGVILLLASFLIIYCWFIQRNITLKLNKIDGLKISNVKKIFYIVAIIGGMGAFISNIILIHKIIPEHGYVLCPKKVGYKKNLLRDYVLDPRKCERF
ncbi:TPA: hypothetical protein ACX6PR_001322 [Photobacterium damselae]